MRKIIIVKKKPAPASASNARILATHQVKQDFLRNAHWISQKDEPAFVEEFSVPSNASKLIITTRRTDLTVEFLR